MYSNSSAEYNELDSTLHHLIISIQFMLYSISNNDVLSNSGRPIAKPKQSYIVLNYLLTLDGHTVQKFLWLQKLNQ